MYLCKPILILPTINAKSMKIDKILTEIEEMGDADSIYENPQKEYTKKLIHAIPKGL